MRGQILTEKRDGRRWLYIPEAHIQLHVVRAGDGKWVVCAFRTDGYYGLDPEDLIPTSQHIERDYELLGELDVPDYIADFAVESERRRQESVGIIENVLKEVFETQNDHDVFQRLKTQMSAGKVEEEFDDAVEQRVGDEVNSLLTK